MTTTISSSAYPTHMWWRLAGSLPMDMENMALVNLNNRVLSFGQSWID